MIDLEKKVKKIISEVFNINVNNIRDDSSPDTIEDWDSLHHMNLVVALEEEFAVEFSGEQINEMLNFRLIIVTLRELIENTS